MSRKKPQVVSIYETIKTHKGIENLEVEKTNKDRDRLKKTTPEEGTLTAGHFKFENVKFSFFDRASKEFGIHRISSSYKIKMPSDKWQNLEEEIESFNLYRVGVKAMCKKIESSEIAISFNIECISNGDNSVVDTHALGLYLTMLRAIPGPLLEKIKSWGE